MKTYSFLLVVALLIGCTADEKPEEAVALEKKAQQQDATINTGPRFKAQVTCFNGGKLDSGGRCTSHWSQPTPNFRVVERKLICGIPGETSEVDVSFIERRDDKDIYRFVRRFPVEPDDPTTNPTTTTNTVEFSDSRVVVFQDEFQVWVIEPSKREQ